MPPVIKLGQKKVIFFDLNNTLADKRGAYREAFLGTLRSYTARWSPPDGWSPELVWEQFEKEREKRAAQASRASTNKGQRKKPLLTQEQQIVCLKKALDASSFPATSAFCTSFLRTLRSTRDEYMGLLPGVVEALTALSAKYQLAIISNGSRARKEKWLAETGLTSWIPANRLFTSMKGKYKKPDPAIFKHALKQMGIKPEEAVMIGDSLRNDIIGACKCGIDAIWLNAQADDVQSHIEKNANNSRIIVIKHLGELLSMF